MTRDPDSTILSLAACLLGLGCLPAQIVTPPVVIKGAAPSARVWSLQNGQTSSASMADGNIVALGYGQLSATTGGGLYLFLSKDGGRTFPAVYPLPQSSGHRVHDGLSAAVSAGRVPNHLHVAWADRSAVQNLYSAYYQIFDTRARRWLGQPTLLARADSGSGQEFRIADLTQTELGTLAVAVEAGAKGGLGMGPREGGLFVKPAGAASFSKIQPLRSPAAPARAQAMSIDAVDEIVHCSCKSLSGGGGIVYRSFDAAKMAWQQPAPVPVGPGANGTPPISGIDAGNRSVMAADTGGNLYILYATGSSKGLANNNKLRLAYATRGKGGANADWQDIEILAHNASVGPNPRRLPATAPAYPQLRGGDTDSGFYTLAPGMDGSMGVVYSKPWETFKSKYVQIYQWGKVVILNPTGAKEIDFWPDKEPYIFERLCGMRSGHSVGMGAWLVYSNTDTQGSVQAPFGMLRMWLLTYSTGRSISFGTACAGLVQAPPRLSANKQFPQINFNYHVDCDRFPASASFLMAVGTKLQHIDLGFMGATGCSFGIDFPLLAPLTVDATGRRRLTWAIPNQSTLIDQSVFCQAFVFAPAANPAAALTSNAIRAIMSN